MMYVNWKKVLEDPPRSSLKIVLCSGDVKLLRGLYQNGFSEYFTSDCPKIITKERAVEMFQGRMLNHVLDSFLANYPVPYFLFDVIGFHVGTAISFPTWINQAEKKFMQSSVGVGREVDYEKVRYVVLFNHAYSDPVYTPMRSYQFLAVPCAVFSTPAGHPLSFDVQTLEVPSL